MNSTFFIISNSF